MLGGTTVELVSVVGGDSVRGDGSQPVDGEPALVTGGIVIAHTVPVTATAALTRTATGHPGLQVAPGYMLLKVLLVVRSCAHFWQGDGTGVRGKRGNSYR